MDTSPRARRPHRLHIGERTVETHLANAYPKLGVRFKLDLVTQAGVLGV